MSRTLLGFPVPCGCGEHPRPDRLPPGMMHAKTEPCPLVSKEYQWEVTRGTCCAEDLGAVISILESFDERELVERLRSPMTAEEVDEAGCQLEACAEEILSTNWGDPDTEEDVKELDDSDTLFVAADWLQKLGREGFGLGLRQTGRSARAIKSRGN